MRLPPRRLGEQRPRPLPKQDQLRSMFRYDPATGHLYWIVPRKGIRVGDRAGSRHGATGYRLLGIDGIRYKEHRIIWAYVHGEVGEKTIDHINLIRDDNRIENLRLATRSENQSNCAPRRTNTSGFKGVTLITGNKNKKWLAQIQTKGRNKYLGLYSTAEEAAEAYNVAALRYHGKFARNA